MKTLKQLHISVLLTMTFMLSVLLATAQGFRVESYQAAIHHIEEQSDGSLDTKTIMEYLHGNIPEVPPDMPEMVTGGFVITPLVAVIEYNSQVVEFSYYPEKPATTSITFEFTPEPDWLNTEPSIATSTFSFEITSNNNSPEANYTTFVATALVGGETNTFQAHIIQKPQPQPFINVSPENIIIEHIGGSQVFSVIIIDADGWDYSTTNGWINEVNGTKTESSIEFSFDQNNDFDARTGSIIFTTTGPDNSANMTVTVFQHGKPAPFLTVDPLSLVAPPEGVSSEFHVITNVDNWKVNIDDTIDWINTVTSTATSFTLDIGTNTNVFREAIIEVTDDDNPAVKEEVYIRQYGVGQSYIIAEPTFITVPPSGATQTYTVNTNVTNWEVEIDTADDWIGVVTHTQTLNSIQIIFAENSSDQTREGTIIFRKDDEHSVADTVGVFQYTAAQPFLVASPKLKYSDPFEGDVEFLVFSNIAWNISSISAPEGMVTDTAVSGDTLTVTVGQNTGALARTSQITLAGGTLTETVAIYQAAPYLLLNPREEVVACVTSTFEVDMIKFGISGVVNSAKPDWVEQVVIGAGQVTITVQQNTTESSRSGYVVVSSQENQLIRDSVQVVQYSCSQPYLLLSPREQVAAWNDTVTENPFALNANLVDDFSVEVSDMWIDAGLNDAKDSLIVSFEPNLTTGFRTAQIKVSDASNPSVFDSVSILQLGVQAYVLITPSFQSITHEGGQIGFNVLTLNVNSWEVVSDMLPGWVQIAETQADTVKFNISANENSSARETKFYVKDTSDASILDSAIIYQKAAPASLLFASPRQHAVLHSGNADVIFKITSVNVQHWEADLGDSDWLIINNPGQQEILSLNVSPNTELETRIAEVTLYDTTNVNIADTVYVYQYSALDTVLLAAPREQWVGHDGAGNLSFEVTAVNIENWQVETASLPAWIGVESSTMSHFTLNIQPNDALETRQSQVRLFVDGHPDIYDSVFVYQYSALDTFLLAAPREQMISHQGDDNVEFQVTSANVENWQVDELTVPDWITVTASGDSLLGLEVSPNDTLQTRIAQIKIFATGQTNIEDFVTVYQFAAPESYLLAAPREQRIPHFGKDTVDFVITQVNVNGWTFTDTSTYEDWITFDNLGDTMRLDVSENTTLESRQALIKIHATENPTVTDSVAVYQFSALDKYILAAPREFEVPYTDTAVNFDVIAVNLEDQWETENLTNSDWIDVLVSGSDILQIDIQTNDTLTSRVASIRLFSPMNPAAADTVAIYQFAAPDPFILIAPREQWAPHTGMQSLNFDVTRVNVQEWLADLGATDWLTENQSGFDTLGLNIFENTTLETRSAKIFVRDTSNSSVFDSVMVYQYSALDTFLLAAPREQSVSFSGKTVEFGITSANVANWVIQPDELPDWIVPGNSTSDTLRLIVGLNDTLETRSATVFIYNQANFDIYDSVSIYQFASPDPYILAAPREKKVSHKGNEEVDFDLTLVNVEDWVFEDTSAFDEWIQFENLGNVMRLNVSANDSLQARQANIVIHQAGNALVRDSVSVYQYSGLDNYILLEPREQLAKRYSGDTLDFKITRINVEEMNFELIDGDGMIDTEATSIFNDTLQVVVKMNNSPNARQAYINVFDAGNPGQASDTVSVFQNFPYIIMRPAAFDSLDWKETAISIETFSNVGEYSVRKGETLDWFQISSDSSNWSNNALILSGNDQVFLRVDTNDNSFLRRSSLLKFEINNEVASEFWFDQNTRPGTTFPVSGHVYIEGDTSRPLPGVKVVLYDSVVVTNQQGRYINQTVPENWIGNITPIIDTALAVPYYFLPPRIEISGLGIIDTTQLAPFAAYKIDPAVTLSPKNAAICFGETLEPGAPNYPTANITDTYGSSTYKWISIPPDPILELNPNVLTPVFGPKETTFYILEVSNFSRTATDFFTIEVNQLPQAFSFTGELSVCRNQAGVIYQVPDPQPGVYYNWALEPGNTGGVFANSFFPDVASGNIAVMDWGDIPGNYKLHLLAFNQFGCAADTITQIIEVTGSEAPPPSTVSRKENDNMLLSSDTLAASYQWGWLEKNSAGEIILEYIIPGKNTWYCRLPDGHTFNPALYNYFVIAYYEDNSCGSRSFFNPPVSIEELTAGELSVFPNPSKGSFTIILGGKTNLDEVHVSVYNVFGNMVLQRRFYSLTSNQLQIDLAHAGVADSGFYFLTVQAAGELFTLKIVIQ